jgi:transposase
MLLIGSSREQVMKTAELTDSAVRKIVRAFNAYGPDGLIAKKRTGRIPCITGQQKEEIIEEFEEPGRAQRTFWTASAFHGHITGKYALECSYATVLRLLHEQGYVLKVPKPWPDRQNEKFREEFLLRLSVLAEDPHIDLWYGDETGVEGEPKLRRTWAMKGSRPKAVHNGDHVRLNIVGCVCPRTGEFFAIEASHCDTDVFQAFLDEAAASIMPARKRNILILDNASWHKGKKLDWHFFEPLYLPPYSPDFNPIERVWLIMKAEYFCNIHCKNMAALVERADHALCALMDNPTKVASAATPIGN